MRREVRANRLDPEPRRAAGDVHRDIGRYRRDLGGDPLRRLTPVGFRQEYHRTGAALPREREVALQPAKVQLRVERGDQEDDVDVGCDDLELATARVGWAPREQALPGKHRLDRAF